MSLQQAFVLHTRPYRDTSLLVDLFTGESGLVTVIAKSARGLKSRFRGQLQLFKPLLVGYRGQGELKSLQQIESNALPYSLSGQSLLCGFYVNELLMRLLHRQEAFTSIFDAYKLVLKNLSSSQTDFTELRYFELHLLEEVGYGLSLTHDVKTGGEIEKDKTYGYRHEFGFFELTEDSTLAVMGLTLQMMSEKKLVGDFHVKQAKMIMRYILSFYLQGRPLKSREMFY